MTSTKSEINWKPLASEEALKSAINESNEKPVVIFKHSTRCSISSMAKSRLENNWSVAEMNGITPYYLDLIANRNISNIVAETLNVIHQSPQVIIVKNGKPVYHTSHMAISIDDIREQLL